MPSSGARPRANVNAAGGGFDDVRGAKGRHRVIFR
jgi:hypothetical protein